MFFGKWSGDGSMRTPVPWYGIVWHGMEPLKGTSTHQEGLIWVRVRKVDFGPGTCGWEKPIMGRVRVRVRKADYGPGAGESGGLGALRHKGVSVATGFVRAWHGRGTKGGNCGQVDAQKKGLVRLSLC